MSRRSVRKYLSDDIDDSLLEKCIKNALQKTPQLFVTDQ